MFEFLGHWGYLGLFLGSFLSSTIVPFSSDILLLGVLAGGGNWWGTVLIATLGNWMGGLTSYWVGHVGKWEWIEKWFKVSEEKLKSQQHRIQKYDYWLALLAWLPIVGDLFSIGLGFYRVNLLRTAVFMLIGRFVRFVAWALIYNGTVLWWNM